jgi:hypothetical protein
MRLEKYLKSIGEEVEDADEGNHLYQIPWSFTPTYDMSLGTPKKKNMSRLLAKRKRNVLSQECIS